MLIKKENSYCLNTTKDITVQEIYRKVHWYIQIYSTRDL